MATKFGLSGNTCSVGAELLMVYVVPTSVCLGGLLLMAAELEHYFQLLYPIV